MKTISPAAFHLQKNLHTVDNKNEKLSAESSEHKKLEKACKDFEAILLNQMMSAMRESIPEGGLFEKSFGEEIYQSMLDEEMTRQMAYGKGMGLGKLLYQQLSDAIKAP